RHLPGHQAHRLMLHRLLVVEVVDPAVAGLADTPRPAGRLPHGEEVVPRLVEDDGGVVVAALGLTEQVQPRDLAPFTRSGRDVKIAASSGRGRNMSKRQRHTPEQVISKLREAEVKLAKGTAIGQVCKDLAITEQTYYRWRKEYGGLRLDQARRLKQLEGENARLKRLLAEAELDKAILREAASGKY